MYCILPVSYTHLDVYKRQLVFQGYAPCHNTEEILENAGYDPEADNENPTGSIFCSHGAGYYVPWQEVPEHMHISSKLEAVSYTHLALCEGGSRNRDGRTYFAGRTI